MSKTLIKAGFVPLPAWFVFVTIAGFFAVDYSPIASHASVMTLQDNLSHPIVSTGAILTGVALILFGFGLWRASKLIFSAGALCWMIFGVAMIANGLYPMGTPMHGLYIIGIANILAPALSLLDMRDEALRKRLYGVTTFISLASVFYIWILLNGFDPEGYQGLTQRIFACIGYAWPFLFAYHYGKQNAKGLLRG